MPLRHRQGRRRTADAPRADSDALRWVVSVVTGQTVASGAQFVEPLTQARRRLRCPLELVCKPLRRPFDEDALDHIAVTDLALEAYERALEPKRLVMTKDGHFDPYLGEFKTASSAAIDWFKTHL